jgi:hypothetical protein
MLNLTFLPDRVVLIGNKEYANTVCTDTITGSEKLFADVAVHVTLGGYMIHYGTSKTTVSITLSPAFASIDIEYAEAKYVTVSTTAPDKELFQYFTKIFLDSLKGI